MYSCVDHTAIPYQEKGATMGKDVIIYGKAS